MPLLLLVGLFLGFTSGAAPSVPVTYRTDYYEIQGDTAEALLASIKARSPFTNHAYTAWHVDWNYEFLIRAGQAELRSFTAQVQVRYTLPKWTDARQARRSLRVEWNRYLAAVARHEQGHADIGVAAAQAITQRIQSKTWQADSREALKKILDAEGERILSEFKQKEAAYDRTTDHGRTQDARLRIDADH